MHSSSNNPANLRAVKPTTPLKVLLVASFRDRADGLHYYFPPRRFLNGLVRLGHCVYTLDDRETARASNPFGSRRWGERTMNRRFLRICDHFRPDAILLYHADTLRRDTVQALRQRHPHTSVGFISMDSVQAKGSKNRVRGWDDLLDAFAALWTAERILRGEAITVPKVPPEDRYGLRMEMVT